MEAARNVDFSLYVWYLYCVFASRVFYISYNQAKFKKYIFYWLRYYSRPIFFSPLYYPPPTYPLPLAFPHLSSCPWNVYISSLASPFPILFLISPYLFCAYLLCFLFPVPFPPIPPLLLPTNNPPCDLHFCDSVPVLVAVSYTHLTLPTTRTSCRSRWSPYH